MAEALEYAGFRIAAGAIAALPHPVSYGLFTRLGELFGRLQGLLRTRQDRTARVNLRLAFPDWTEARRDEVRLGMWRNWGGFVADTAFLARASTERLRELVRLDTPERFAEVQAIAKERGALVLTAHFGSFELLHAGSAAHGQPITIVHRTMPNRRIDDYLARLRAKVGTRSLARGFAAREILEALRGGQVVAIPFDQAPRKVNRVFAPFFGVDAATNSGLARLALSSGAPVCAVLLVREGKTRKHRMLVGPEIPVARTGDRERDLLDATRKFNEALEAIVREHPEHWIWGYRRWKTRPDDLVSPYEPNAPPPEEYRRRTRERCAPS